MNRKRYCLKISYFAMIITVVFLPLAKTQEKPSVQRQKAILNNPGLNPSNKIANTIRGSVTDKLGRSRGNVFIAPQSTNIWKGIRSDTQGQFTLEDIKPDQRNWVAYSQASRTMGLFAIPEDYAGQPIHVILSFNAAIAEGRVVGPDGKGLAGRSVELLVKTKHGLTYRFPCHGKTDQYGNYGSRTPCGSGLSIQAKLVDGTEAEKRFATKPFALSDDQITISIPRLVIGEGNPEETDDGKVLYSGRVVNEQDEPLRGVRVDMWFKLGNSTGDWGRKDTMTDEHGQWRQRLPRDFSDIRIGLLHPEYIRQKRQKISSAELLNGTNVKVMKRGLTLKGTVKNVRGGPIENALVDTGGSGSTTSYGEVIENCTTPRTLADGSFSVGGLPAGRIDIVVSAVGYAPRFVSVEIEAGLEPIEVSLKQGETYIGKVVDIDGNPIEAVKIDVDEWRIGNKRKTITRITETDSQGFFRIENLPEEGKLGFDFGKRGNGFESFSKMMPEDISQIDQIVMYKTPVFTGKVIDVETEEPITKFTLINGIRSLLGDSFDWSRYGKKDVTSESGAFSINWEGYHINYPFDGFCCLKVEAKGYLPEIAPPMKLGEKCEPFVIRLTKTEPWKGIVVDHKGNPAANAEVGWVGPSRKAFIQDGKFDRRGFVYQAEVIVQTDENGQFELNPTREQGLIVVVHPTGYAHVKSSDFDNASQIQLTPWAKIEGTIISSDEDSQEFVVAATPIMSSEDDKSQLISWRFEQISVSGKHFIIDYVPSIPLHVGQIVRWEYSSPAYLKPKPGETYQIRIGGRGRTVTGKIIHPIPERARETGEDGMSNPRRLHAVAYCIEPESKVPDEIKDMSQDSFQWLWRDATNVYERSKTFDKRFIANIEDNGIFRFENIPPGKYEYIVNYHAPLGENVSCGRGVLEAVAINRFKVDTDGTRPIHLPDITMNLLTYPEIGDPASFFEARSLEGKVIRLEDFRGKVVLLDFWATWCAPCIDQMPKAKEIYEAFAANPGFAMIGMSVDWDLDKAKRFVVDNGLQWPHACLGNMAESLTVKQYGIGAIPTAILIGRDGKILTKNTDVEQLKSALARALGVEREK